ncbi:rhodanese-like domain-containing protein [Carboxylicivirga taeanensis]|uniref:rhodanese-like domain-containing protein n=1 Tax=Carboxylicivirga taeanensis TaxID=1416875 RepID=UPI003F6DF8A0
MKHFSILLLLLCACILPVGAQNSKRVNAKLFYSLTQKHPRALIVDVRPAKKFNSYRIKNAMPAPEKRDLIELCKAVSKSDTIFVYCEKDLRTGPAAEVLDSLGYINIIQLKGGLISWRRNGLPVENLKQK